MTSKLKNLQVLEVSLVPKAANLRKFLIRKSMSLDSILNTAVEGEDELLKDIAPEKVDATRAMIRLGKSTEMIDIAKALSALGLPQTVEVVKEVIVEKSVPVVAETFDPSAVQDEKLKVHLESIAKATREAEARAEALQKALDDEKDRRETTEFIQKAASEYKSLPVKADELGLVLKALKRTDVALLAKVESILKAVAGLVDEKLTPIGQVGIAKGTEGTASTWDQVSARAKEMVRKGEAPSEAVAIDRIFTENPNLYSAYVAEKGK